MANKYFRQNFNKGGGADTGKVGERKSKTAVTVDKLKKRLKRIGRPASVTGIKGLFDRKPSTIKKKTSKSPMERQRKLDTFKSEAAKTGGKVMAADEMTKLKGESDKSFKQRMDKAFKAKKGGRAAFRMGTKKNFNKGGGADSGRMGEIKSKVTLLGDKFRKMSEKIKDKKIKVFDKETNKNIFINRNELMKNLDRYNPATGTERLSEGDIKRAKKALNMKKGGRAKMMGGGMMGRRFGMKEGSLKPVDPKTQKGLSKLPTEVRNKMGYMKKGGRA